MKHLEEHYVQGNRSEKDILFYYTTTGKNVVNCDDDINWLKFNFCKLKSIIRHTCLNFRFRLDDVELDGLSSCTRNNSSII